VAIKMYHFHSRSYSGGIDFHLGWFNFAIFIISERAILLWFTQFRLFSNGLASPFMNPGVR
jgi:hypothetical protein